MYSVKDFGALHTERFVSAHAATAGAGTDNSEQTGASIDRTGYLSGTAAIAWTATLASGATLSLTVKEQESADGSTWDTATTVHAAAVVATGESGGSTETGITRVKVNLSGKKKYVRYNVTSDLSAANTDTSVYGALMILGGADEHPAS